MQSNCNSLQKPYQMSERKCLAVFLKDNEWSLAQCSNLLSTFDLVGKCQSCAFNKSTGNSHVDGIYLQFYMHYARTRVGDTLQ